MGIFGGKGFLIFGGFLGFIISFTSSFLAENDISTIVLTGSIGCLIGTFLSKMFQKVLGENLQAARTEKFHVTKSAPKNVEKEKL